MDNMEGGSQIQSEGNGSPKGSDALLDSIGAVNPSGAESVGEQQAQPDSGGAESPLDGGVKPYSDDEIKDLDPTSLDFSRVDASNFEKVIKRQRSVYSNQIQKRVEEEKKRDKEYSERFANLEAKLEAERTGATGKLVEHLTNEKTEAAKRERERQEQEFFENLSDEGKLVYKMFKSENQSLRDEISSLKQTQVNGEMPKEVKEALEKLNDRELRERTEATTRTINGVISNYNAPEAAKKDQDVGDSVRAMIQLIWGAEKEAYGHVVTPLEQVTTIALDKLKRMSALFNQASAAAPTTPQQTSAAQAAPPRIGGATTPSKPGVPSYEQQKNDYWAKFGKEIGASGQ